MVKSLYSKVARINSNLSVSTLIKKIKESLPGSLRVKLPKEIGVVEIRPSQSSLFNKIYRGRKKSTNVLSFYYGSGYGEILVCPEIIRQEAKKQDNSFQYQMTWMILHGILHLAGVHHENSRALAKKAELIEQKILGKIGNDL